MLTIDRSRDVALTCKNLWASSKSTTSAPSSLLTYSYQSNLDRPERVTDAISPEILLHIKQLYHDYRHTTDLERKGLFFSPQCLQICRPTPSYAATSREEIVQYLREAQNGNVPLSTDGDIIGALKGEDSPRRSVYTIRPLQNIEVEFGTNVTTTPIGKTVEELKDMAKLENWVGMRVDLWDEGAADEGLLVKVQYWWRLEQVCGSEQVTEIHREWRQCLHDILYIGSRDGTEGKLGLEILV